jgi:hypothetical protein
VAEQIQVDLLTMFRKATLLGLVLSLGIAFQASAAKNDITPLTMPKIQSTLEAFTNLGELLASDPALAKQFKEEAKREEGDTDKTGDNALPTALRKLQAKDGRVGAAFSKAGISTDEASLVIGNLVATAMGDAMLQGKPIPKDMDPALAENLKFYRQHKQELTDSFQKLQSLTAKLNGGSDE